MNATEIKVKLLLTFLLKAFDLSSYQESEIIHRIIEYQLWMYVKDHLDQSFFNENLV